MTAPHAQTILDGYMARLERELEDVDTSDRSDLVGQVESHIVEARKLLEAETDSDLLNILDRLGSPAVLASELRGRRPAGARPAEVATRGSGAAGGLVEVTALVGCVVLLPLGLILAWVSRIWSRRDKLVATGIPLAALAALVIAWSLPAVAGTHPVFLAMALFAPVLNPVGLVCAAFLAFRLWRDRAARAAPAATGSGPTAGAGQT
jgi:uncharacterized membrane protein